MFVKRFYLESLQVLITHSTASLDPMLYLFSVLQATDSGWDWGTRYNTTLLVSCMLKGIPLKLACVTSYTAKSAKF